MTDTVAVDARTLTFLNMSGHSTLTWSPANDELMRALIEKKMGEGFTFFLLKPRLGGVLPDRRVRVKDISEAMDARKLSLDDEDFAKLIADGGVQMVTTPERGSRTMADAALCRDPAAIASGHSVAVRQMSGG